MNFETAFRRIKELKRENSVAKEILDLYQNILEFQRTSFERTGINYEELPASLAVEKPLIQIIEKEIKSENISKLFEDFFEFISLFGTPQMKESAKKAKGNRYFSPEKVKESLTGSLLEVLCPIKISLPNRPITNNRFVMFSIPNSSPETY